MQTGGSSCLWADQCLAGWTKSLLCCIPGSAGWPGRQRCAAAPALAWDLPEAAGRESFASQQWVWAANLAVTQTKGLTLLSPRSCPEESRGAPLGRVGCDQGMLPKLIPQLISVFLLVIHAAQLYSPNTNSWKDGSCSGYSLKSFKSPIN